MISLSGTKRHENNVRGFSLIELAIVLGVFGMIVSGLWGVVSTVKESIKRERAFEQTVLIVRNIRSFFQASANNAFSGISGAYSSYTSNMATLGIIPFDFIRNRSAPPYLVDLPWGPPTSVSGCTGGFCVCDNASVGNCDGGSADTTLQTFMVRLQGVPYGACIHLADRLTGASGPGGLSKAYINKTLYTLTTGFPIPPSWSKTACQTDVGLVGKNSLDFVYKLRQQTF